MFSVCKSSTAQIASCCHYRSELLRAWKRQNGLNATYEKLLEACVATYNADAAETIIQLLNGKHLHFTVPENKKLF